MIGLEESSGIWYPNSSIPGGSHGRSRVREYVDNQTFPKGAGLPAPFSHIPVHIFVKFIQKAEKAKPH